jgi:hypothetical protein
MAPPVATVHGASDAATTIASPEPPLMSFFIPCVRVSAQTPVPIHPVRVCL